MSVILDVLRKLDRERPSLRNEKTNIAVEILRPDLPRSKRKIPLYLIVVSITAIATAAITFGLMKEFGFISKPSSSVTLNPPAPSRPARPVPPEVSIQTKSSPPSSVGASAPSQQVAPPTVSREPVRETREDISKVVPKAEAPPESKVSEVSKVPVESKPSSGLPEEKKASQDVIPEKKDIVPIEPPKKSAGTPMTEQVKSPPSLNISAIVWYEDPSMRFAIVNGLKATEGSLVDGVKVVEIKSTSVRFLQNNQYFEVSITR